MRYSVVKVENLINDEFHHFLIMSVMQKQYQKILRTLMKNPNNRKCADCGEQCPVNVDTTHGIFVCANCAGIHREFGDRIKSVSMASFTQDEISLLQKQTNEDFNKIYMAKWNPQEDPLPQNVDDNRKRAFLQLKYIQRIWYSKEISNNQNKNENIKQNQNNLKKTNPFVLNQPVQNKREQLNQIQSTNQIQAIPSSPIHNKSTQPQNTNDVDLLDLDFVPQQVKKQEQPSNIQQSNDLLDLGENQNSIQNSSRQGLKDFIEGMEQGNSSFNSFNGFNNSNNFGGMNVQNDLRYHFTQPKPNTQMLIAKYKTGGFGGDTVNKRMMYAKPPNNHFGTGFGAPNAFMP